MDLVEAIRVFRRVVETRSFSAVAKEREVSQPSISKMIQALELRLGTTLLRRSTRGLSLTTEGQKLFDLGAGLIERADELVSKVRSSKFALEGELRLSVSLAFARLILAPLIPEFEKLHPALRLNLNLHDGYVDLVEGRIDLALRIGNPADSGLHGTLIGTSRRALFVAQSYLERHGRPLTIQDLRGHKLLYYTRLAERPSWPLKNDLGHVKPFAFEPHLKTDGSDLIRECVLAGVGIALLPTWMMMSEAVIGQTERLFEAYAPPASPIFALSATGGDLTEKQRVAIEFLRRSFATTTELNGL